MHVQPVKLGAECTLRELHSWSWDEGLEDALHIIGLTLERLGESMLMIDNEHDLPEDVRKQYLGTFNVVCAFNLYEDIRVYYIPATFETVVILNDDGVMVDYAIHHEQIVPTTR